MKRVLALALIGVAIVPWVATRARASCIGPPPTREAIREVPAVFVGTVVEIANMRRWVTVEVLDVWKGQVDPEVEVRAGPKDPPGPTRVASSVDRHYRLGETYLFFPYRGDGEIFRDSNCSRTTRYEPSLERFRPTPISSPSESTTLAPTSRTSATNSNAEQFLFAWIAAGMVALIVGLLAAATLRKRNRGGSQAGARTDPGPPTS